MKYVIFSDVQGNYPVMKTFQEGMTGFHRDKTLCLGDIISKGTDFNDNRVIDLIRGFHDVTAIRGNHEDISNTQKPKLTSQNLDFLSRLEKEVETNGLLLFHSSVKSPGKRLKSEADIAQEFEYLRTKFRDAKTFLFGHSHKPGVFSVNPANGQVKFVPPSKGISLDESLRYFVNSGGLGLHFNQPQTFAVLDTTKKRVDFYSLNELREIDYKRRVVNLFSDEIMPHLTGDAMSVSSLQQYSRALSVINSAGQFDGILDMMRSFNLPSKKGKSKSFADYSLKLANQVRKSFTSDVTEHYSVNDPLESRRFALRE